MRQRRRTFLKEWRIYRNLTQKELGERVGVTHTMISKVENGRLAYTQDYLEAVADALSVDPASLLMRNPSSPDFIWSLWEAIPDDAKPQAQAVLKTFSQNAGDDAPPAAPLPKRVRK